MAFPFMQPQTNAPAAPTAPVPAQPFTSAAPVGAQPSAPPAGWVNPIFAAVANAKVFSKLPYLPRANASYVAEVDAIKSTGEQGDRFFCAECTVVAVEDRGGADQNGTPLEKAFPVGTKFSITENITQGNKGGPGRAHAMLMGLAGETESQMDGARMAKFWFDDKSPMPNFPNLGLGLRYSVHTSPGFTKPDAKGVRNPTTNKNYQHIGLPTAEEQIRVNARRSAANLPPIEAVWKT